MTLFEKAVVIAAGMHAGQKNSDGGTADDSSIT